MNRMFAIIEREMRKFFRSPTLMIMSMMMPMVQLSSWATPSAARSRGRRVAVVDYDHGPQAVKIREAFDAIAANIKTFTTVDYTTSPGARRRAHRQDRRRRHHPRAVLAPRLRAGRARARPGGR
jgi:ABC-2 type transport system permease protein